MKSISITFLCFFIWAGTFAQSQFELSFDANQVGTDIKIDYFIQKISGPDFAIGASNFPLRKENFQDLNWSQIQPDFSFISPFFSTPNSYSTPIISASNFINYTQLTNFGGVGNGFLVSSTKTHIGSFLVPITGACPEAEISWVTNWGAINSFSTSGEINSIKSGAIFTNPTNTAFKFYDIPGVPLIQPVDSLQACDGNAVALFTNDLGFEMQWFKDGIEISGANDSIFYASLSGTYSVEYLNCNLSERSGSLNVNILPLPEKSIITENSGLLYSSVGKNIQWYHNNLPIANATDSVLSPSNSGIYTVKSTTACGEIFSDPFNYAPLSVDFSQNGASLRVFPNPYIGKTNIVVTLEQQTELTVEVYDLKGNLVSLVEEGVYDEGEYKFDFSAQTLGRAAGTYVLKVRTNEKELIHNLVELK